MSYFLSGLALIGSLYLLHWAALWMEGRGWIRYQRKRGSSGSLGNAMREIQTIFEPSKRYVLEERLREHSEAERTGDPPSKPAAS